MKPKRDPVNYNYSTLNWDFLHQMAVIALYAAGKHGSTTQYQIGPLTGEKSPVNHMVEHLRMYLSEKPHDIPGIVDGHAGHLVSIAYNAMMEYFYATGQFTGVKDHCEVSSQKWLGTLSDQIEAHREALLNTEDKADVERLVKGDWKDAEKPPCDSKQE